MLRKTHWQALSPLILVILVWCLSATPVFAQQFPALSGRVVDAAGIIPAPLRQELGEKLTALETQSQRQLVVVTLPDLQGYDISDYGYRLGRAWGIGSKDRNDGVLLIVAPNERQVRIEVGYGLEPILTDGLSSLIISQAIIPHFRDNDMAGGIEAGVDAIANQLQLPPEEARKVAAEAQAKAGDSQGSSMAFFALFFLLFFILPAILRRKGHTGMASAVGPVILWNAPVGGSGGSRGGGGGFSGGGGSFGGGGASGRW